MSSKVLKKAIEYFVPASGSADADYRRRVRLVAYTIFFTTLFAFFYVVTSWLAEFFKAAWIMLGCTMGFTALLFMLRAGISLVKVANLFGAIGMASIIGCVYFGGGLYSATLPWLAFPPIVMLLLIGKKWGYFWIVSSVFAVSLFAALNSEGYHLVKHYPASQELLFYFSCYAGLVMIVFLLAIVFENIRIRAHHEVVRQKVAAETALAQLKVAQLQLVQQEKMASLGEMTSGIAHEIQNPLNFINNFSAVNKELIEELKASVETGNINEVLALADLIKINDEKIVQHGSRADGIVKNMMQHSRNYHGSKQATDLNALTGEYLKLAYHSFHTKHGSFCISLETDFDLSIVNVHLFPHEIGTVLLNLFNNAFYSVNEKSTRLTDSYKPLVSVSTGRKEDSLVVIVKDNGLGIEEAIRDKVYQPFFTTKPTGVGVGLGLSLSYDIVTKGHGGTLWFRTVQGEGVEFFLELPV